MRDFVGFLDKYKNKRLKKHHYYELLNKMNMFFLETNYNSIKKKQRIEPRREQQQPLPQYPPYFFYYSQPLYEPFYNWDLYNNNPSTQSLLNHIVPPVTLNPTPPEETPVIQIIGEITIDDTIATINDLIKVADNHIYDPSYEYNINLYMIHKIKPELELLDKMVGMKNIKSSIFDQILYFMQGLHIGPEMDYKHTVICGPPGTGKTEIAKIIGRIYSKMGVFRKGGSDEFIFKKVTRNDLVAGYLGQTAIKTQKVIEKALGGVLFIDEAYSLGVGGSNDSYSKECIDTLCEALSDHRDDLMVIIAGYENELNETFFPVNQGLKSRFIWRFKMDDYSPRELMEIFMKKVAENGWEHNFDIVESASWFEKNGAKFRNYGRDIELLFSYTKVSHSRRIYGKPASMRKKITMEDIKSGFEIFLKNANEKKENMIFRDMFI